ncbi:MAG: hypothetical protein HKP39_06155 [Eudoraea sp.]|nr:hypothetical protein [Eudoraea sp.]
MNTKRILFGLATCLVLVAAASCTPNTAEDDQLYEQSLDKTKVTKKI